MHSQYASPTQCETHALLTSASANHTCAQLIPQSYGVSFLSFESAHPNWRCMHWYQMILTVINHKSFLIQHTLTRFPQHGVVTLMLLQTAVFQSSMKPEPRAKTHIQLLAQTKSSRFLLWWWEVRSCEALDQGWRWSSRTLLTPFGAQLRSTQPSAGCL